MCRCKHAAQRQNISAELQHGPMADAFSGLDSVDELFLTLGERVELELSKYGKCSTALVAVTKSNSLKSNLTRKLRHGRNYFRKAKQKEAGAALSRQCKNSLELM